MLEDWFPRSVPYDPTPEGSPMSLSPKGQAYLLLALSILFGVGPQLDTFVADAGMHVPPWMKLVGALLGSIGTIVFAQLPALKHLAGADGTNSSGAPGLTLGGTPSQRPPPVRP